jgi:SAM-dependent methyltransferase
LDRIARLLGAAGRSHRILEIGAGYCPVAPKSAGWHSHVVDHAARDELRAKYARAGVDTDLIEDVDTIWRGGPLHEAVPANLLGQFDLIVASHVLEHIPDLLGFFQSASRLVAPGGSLSVALPDRRYCFDCFRPWTTTGAVLEAHHPSMSRHSLKTAFDHMAYSATMEGQLAWGPRAISKPAFMDPFAAAVDAVALFGGHPDGHYQDYHAWQFTPASFRLTMLELAGTGVSDWRVDTLDGPENFEFFAVLRRGGTKPSNAATFQAQRQELLFAQLVETREQIDFMLGGVDSASGPRQNSYGELIERLTELDIRLREMAETLTWLRAALRPLRKIWRLVRRRV